MADIDDILGEITPERRTVPVCVRGGLSAQIEALEAELVHLNRTNDTLGDNGVQELAERIHALELEAAEHTHDFVFESIGKQAWHRLLAEHPPTKKQRDDRFEANPDTFQPAAIAACCISPAMTVEQATQLAERLSDGQWAKLWQAVADINIRDGGLPKSELATAILRASGPSSTTAAREASPEASS
jgi:hypothetical protein